MSRRLRALWAFVVVLAVTIPLIWAVVLLRPGPDRRSAPDSRPAADSPPQPQPQPVRDGTTIEPCAQADPPPDGRPSERLTVLTFNIHAGLGGPAPDSGLEQVANEIEAWDADVVLLQEVDRHRERTGFVDQPAWLAERLDLDVVFGRNVVRPPDRSGRPRHEYGTAILSRLPIQASSNRLLPNQPGLEQRGLLRATVRVAGQLVDVHNTHLQHTRGNIRILQVLAIRELLQQGSRPQILGGDLNAEPESPALQILSAVVQDPWPAVGEDPGLTVPARESRRRIDYVLHDETFVPVDAQTLLSSVSDHRAVRVTFDVLRPSGCG